MFSNASSVLNGIKMCYLVTRSSDLCFNDTKMFFQAELIFQDTFTSMLPGMLSGPNHVDVRIKETNMKVCLFDAHRMSCCYVFYYLVCEPLKRFIQCFFFMDNLIFITHSSSFGYSYLFQVQRFFLRFFRRRLITTPASICCISRLFQNLTSTSFRASRSISENIWPRYYPFLLY